MFEERHMPGNDSSSEWDAKFKGFLKKAGEDFKRAAGDVKKEAERLMKEAQDPERQAKVRAGVQEASVWARKTAEQLATLMEDGVKQAEGALAQVASRIKTTATQPVDDTPAPAPTPVNAAPPTMEQAPPPAPEPKKPAKKTVGRGAAKKKSAAAKGAAKKKSIGRKAPAAPAEPGDDAEG